MVYHQKRSQTGLHSIYLFSTYTEYFIWVRGLEELKVGIKIIWRNVNKQRYAVNTGLILETEEDLRMIIPKQESEKQRYFVNV